MNIFSRLVKRNPNTLLGKVIEKHKKKLGPLSFILFSVPVFTLCMIFIVNNTTTAIPSIYKILIGWYFLSLYLVDKIKKDNNDTSEIIEMIICLPVYLSVCAAYFIIRIFINKKNYPNITEDKLPLYQRKIKVKKLKRKIRGNKIFG